ncbi:MAG: A24 family peptidase [Defluviitaleaceae bacterium]|nr:A24 family peptidase [Defluviitaleaceae bacterium]
MEITENQELQEEEQTKSFKEELLYCLEITKKLSLNIKIILSFAFIAALFVATLNFITGGINLIQMFSMYATLAFVMFVAIIDTKKFIIPNSILLIWLITRAAFILAEALFSSSLYPLITSLTGAIIVFLLFLTLYYVTKKSLGGGDVKFSFVLGLSLTNYLIFTAVFYSLLVCAIFSLIALATKKLTKKDALPLGPFFFIGTTLSNLAVVLGNLFQGVSL